MYKLQPAWPGGGRLSCCAEPETSDDEELPFPLWGSAGGHRKEEERGRQWGDTAFVSRSQDEGAA